MLARAQLRKYRGARKVRDKTAFIFLCAFAPLREINFSQRRKGAKEV
jgi:hypothetical protein